MRPDLVAGIERDWKREATTQMLSRHFERWQTSEPALQPFASPIAVLRFLHGQGDSAAKDRVLKALLYEARSDVLAARFVLRAILPGLKGRMRRTLADQDERDELWSILVDVAWEHIRTYPRDDVLRRVAATLVLNIVRDSFGELRRRRREATELSLRANVPSSPAPDDGDSGIEALLVRAVAAGAVTEYEAELVLATRIDGRPLASIAKAQRVSYNTMKLRRQRAERRLLLWLGYRAVPRGQQKRPSRASAS